jgi:regulatory protein
MAYPTARRHGMVAAMPPPLPAPDESTLHEAALAYLARFAATTAGLRAVLERRVDRWAREQPDRDAAAESAAAARQAVAAVVARLAAAGAVSDAAFAESRARSLTRSGRSQRAVQAQLAAKGVPADLARAAAPDDPETEIAAALVLARKRRIGPFRTGAPSPQRELGILARAGFSRSVALRVLDTPLDDAEAAIRRLRDG